MMVSYANDPQISADIEKLPELLSTNSKRIYAHKKGPEGPQIKGIYYYCYKTYLNSISSANNIPPCNEPSASNLSPGSISDAEPMLY